jgi:nitrite reductase/ring-hydroxylating ferredoxin subunit
LRRLSGSFPEPSGPPIVLVTDDAVVRGRLEATAREMEAVLLGFRTIESCRLPGPPRVMVVDLRVDGSLEAIGAWKRLFPDVPVVAILAIPKPDLWAQAEANGADLVCTHGTVHRRLPDFLAEHRERSSRIRRVRVGSARDLDGRLGLVASVTDRLPEEVAIYHLGHEAYAVSNTCPHAGARLSEGPLEGPVITCPRHGSQFDVRTGERLRGPADDALRCYRVTVEEGSLYVEFEADDDPRFT